jgi:hypothetical protein
MSHKVKALLVVSGALLATYAFSQDSQQQMTPEQKAEMEAYTKAGTPGAPHKALASTVGTYDLKIKNWHEPGGPPMEEKGTATRKMALDGRVLVEEVKSTRSCRPWPPRPVA